MSNLNDSHRVYARCRPSGKSGRMGYALPTCHTVAGMTLHNASLGVRCIGIHAHHTCVGHALRSVLLYSQHDIDTVPVVRASRVVGF